MAKTPKELEALAFLQAQREIDRCRKKRDRKEWRRVRWEKVRYFFKRKVK